MKPMYGYRQMTTTAEVKAYLNSWHVPCIVEDTTTEVVVKVPEGALRLVTLVKCNTIPQLSMRLSFTKMTFGERLRCLLS
ncbi:MAG: hypothetical protein ACN6OP_25595 [Pseudomonadales bacterium]